MTDNSRNAVIAAELDEILARPVTERERRLHRLFGGEGSDTELDAEIREREYERHLLGCSLVCSRHGCGHEFVEGDVVCRYRQHRFGEARWDIRAICEACVRRSGFDGDLDPVPCAGGCGVLVASPRYYWSKYQTCSARCAERARRLARQNPPRDCAECGEEFVPTRTDQQFHSNACRQKAYRRRKAA